MRKSFRFTCGLTVALIVSVGMGARSAAQEPGSGGSSKPPASASGTGTQSPTGQAGTSSQATPNDVPTPDSDGQDASPTSQPQDQNADKRVPEKSKAQRAKEHVKKQMSSWCVGAPVNHCYEKKSSDDDQQKDASKQGPVGRAPRSDDAKAAPPTASGESSSRDTKVDLSPPPGEANDFPESAPEPDSAGEFHAWDPHRAMKNVEIGDYYFKQQNYRAALSRYKEALDWKPRDAEATFKLASAYEKLGDNVDAKDNYEKYLGILPKGPRADDAKKALARLTN